MVDRLLDKLEPKRHHLTWLVVLLVLTFVLASGLALQAHRTQTARSQEAYARYTNTAQDVQERWAKGIEERLGNMLLRTFPLAALNSDHAIPLDDLAASSQIPRVCPRCDRDISAVSYFSITPHDGAVEYRGEAVSRQLAGQVTAALLGGRSVPVQETVRAGIYFLDDGGLPRLVVAFGLTDGAERVTRIVGALVDGAAAASMLRMVLDVTDGIPASLVEDRSNSELFSTEARAGRAPILVADEGDHLGVPTALDTGAVSGLSVRLALRDDALAMLLSGTGGSISPVLILLMALIVVVLGLALVLVRRESELVRLRAEFISGVSHELRTPLAQIRMFTETLLLGRTRSDIERRRSLEIIDQEARRLTHLVENVLLFSKGEGGRRPALSPQPTAFADEIGRAMESFGPMCRTRSAEIRAELQEGISGSVDRNALRQILVNLLENALKYGPDGQRITVGLALYDDAARIWVDDEGPGIPAADRERIFDAFYRLRREVESRISGSGIGLSVVRELARLHGGTAHADSAPGGGARIVVEFPGAYLRADKTAEFHAAS